MSNSIIAGETSEGHKLKIDLMRLVDSRAIVQANSGGGKSYFLRGIAEQSAGQLQTIILDPEGEFATLREHVDLLLIGRDGEIQPNVRAAKLLARKLVELNVSAVVDLYDLRLDQRREFVRDFCESLLSLPRELWHPTILAIDECHLFAPERSAGESVATNSVIGIASQGRKRGIGLIALTQRLSKLHKDVAAELNNVFIGRTWLKNDTDRCGDLLGMNKSERGLLRDLEPGQFYAFGPALHANGVVQFKAATVKTTHPKAGERHKAEPPKPSKVIREIAAELADLPQVAEAEIKDLACAKAKISTLERELKSAPKAPSIEVSSKQDRAIIANLRKGLAEAMKVIAEMTAKGFEKTNIDPALIEKALQAAKDEIVKSVSAHLTQRDRQFEGLKREATQLLGRLQKLLGDETVNVQVAVKHNDPFTVTSAPKQRTVSTNPTDAAGRSELSPSERDVLDAAASFPEGATRQRISIFSGRSIKSSSFVGCFPELVRRGLLRQNGDKFSATDEGAALANPTVGTTLNDWMHKLVPSEAKVLKTLADAYPSRLTRDEVSEKSGQSILSSSFMGAFPALRDLALIEGTSDFAIVPELAEAI